jgi:hypothetical protein
MSDRKLHIKRLSVKQGAIEGKINPVIPFLVNGR